MKDFCIVIAIAKWLSWKRTAKKMKNGEECDWLQ